MNWPWRITLFCGVAPLLTGTLIFISWWASRASWLMGAGVYTIITGLVLFAVGLISLIVFGFKARAARAERWGRRVAGAGFLLLANFPAAAIFIMFALDGMNNYTVVVENKSDKAVDKMTLIDPTRTRHEFGSVASHGRREKDFHFGGEGQVTYEMEAGGKSQSGILFGYISSPQNGHGVITIGQDGVAHSEERF